MSTPPLPINVLATALLITFPDSLSHAFTTIAIVYIFSGVSIPSRAFQKAQAN